jgi:hypothetical protein
MGVDLYTIGKGLLSIDSVFMGNAPEVTFEIKVDTRLRYRAATNSCVRYVAETQVTGKSGKLRFQLDEFSDDVIALATKGKMNARVVLTQTNLVGPKRVYTFNSVNIWPSGLQLISDEFGVMAFEGDVIFAPDLTWGSIA